MLHTLQTHCTPLNGRKKTSRRTGKKTELSQKHHRGRVQKTVLPEEEKKDRLKKQSCQKKRHREQIQKTKLSEKSLQSEIYGF